MAILMAGETYQSRAIADMREDLAKLILRVTVGILILIARLLRRR